MNPHLNNLCLQIILVVAVAINILGCDSKQEERTIKRVKGFEIRIEDYRQSHFFDRSLSDFSVRLQKWNGALAAFVESQSGFEKDPVVNNSLDLVLPILREAQRGFFKKGGKGWQKEIVKVERLLPDKEVFLEKMTAEVEATTGAKNNPWRLKASGRYPKEQTGDLFQIHWQPSAQELKIESLQKGETPFACTVRFREEGDVQEAHCQNLILYRFDNKDLNLLTLNYHSKTGFSGEGKVTNSKGIAEKFNFPISLQGTSSSSNGESH